MKKPHARAWGFSATLGLLALALALGWLAGWLGLLAGWLGWLGGLWGLYHFDHGGWRRGEHLGKPKLNSAESDLAHAPAISDCLASDEGFGLVVDADVQHRGLANRGGS